MLQCTCKQVHYMQLATAKETLTKTSMHPSQLRSLKFLSFRHQVRRTRKETRHMRAILRLPLIRLLGRFESLLHRSSDSYAFGQPPFADGERFELFQ
jgi:hypothetical protein